ncbi:MAG TPA: serine hydrolase domain-containing protein [Candidatus Sulfotelmatobacter sp.]|nr:serine hydrolase domain-containing protein [Candidatus Sulfotelmatobacter sp.]
MRLAALATLILFLTGVRALSADTNQQRVDQIFSAYDKTNSPGCALGVIRDGNFVYRKGYGMGSLELHVPLSPESVFYLGSVSKQFTAASVVLAAEQGFLALDDSVRKYIPELPDYGHVITLRQMLHHTSGLRDFLTLLELSGRRGEDVHSRAEMLDLIARQKALNNIPGDEWIYSNTNYFLLGEVVQRATKKSLAEFAAENIFLPLGMAHTRYYDDHTLVMPGRVPAYATGDGGKFVVDWSTNFDTVGAGGLMSSIDDLLLWDRNFYENRLGKGAFLKEMQTRGVLNSGKKTDYALGLELSTYRGLPIVEHNGGLFGYRTEILRFPEQRFTVVCLCNLASASTGSLARKVAEVYLEKSLQAEAGAAESAGNKGLPDPSLFAGRYLDPSKHFVYSFTAAGGNLMAWGSNLPRVGPNQFRDLGTGTITFENAEGGMRAKLETDGGIFFAGKRIETQRFTEADLAAYAGEYQSTELDVAYDLSIEQGNLIVRNKWNPLIKLSPVVPDEFESEEFNVVFQRDSSHGISGLRVFTIRARDLSFERVR